MPGIRAFTGCTMADMTPINDANMSTINANTAIQIIKIATLSSVQILVLVIAGTSGFIVSLLGLIIPDALKSSISSRRNPTRPHSRPGRRSANCPSPSSSRPSSVLSSVPSSVHSSSLASRNDQSSISSGLARINNVPVDAVKTSHTAPAMTRGDSTTSKASTIPELGDSSGTTTSCSSSISDHDKHHHNHHHGINANALYSGIVNKCKVKKASSKGGQSSERDEQDKHSSTSPSSRKNTSSPRHSHEGVRSILSSLMIPHSHAREGSSHSLNNKERAVSSGHSSPITPEDGSSRTSTLPDASRRRSIDFTSLDGLDHARSRTIGDKSHTTTNQGPRPPFLTRMFTFSTSSSSTSTYNTSSSSVPPSNENITTISSINKQTFPDISSSSAPVISKTQPAGQPETSQTRPRARRLSTRLVSFGRSMSHSGSMSMNKSRRVASETGLSIGISESGSDATIIPQDGSTVDKEGELTSPPHTPRLGSLPSSTSATFTPGSSAPYSPLKSPLSRRSFFGISSSPSKQSLSLSPSSSSSSTSPVVKEERVRLTEGRALPVSSRPRQGANHRALSYAPFTASSSHATVVQRNRIYSSAIKREMNNEEVAFVPFHPFSDSDYRASSLDLSGTSALTMSLHFSEHVGKEGGRGEAQSQLRR